MSRERTSVFGIVVVTMFITSAVLVAGWFGATRYLAQQTVSAPHEEAPAAPAPRRKGPKAAKSGNGRAVQEAAASTDAASASAPEVASRDGAKTRADGEPLAATGRGSAAPPAEVEPPRSVPAEPTPAAEVNAAPAAVDRADARTIMEEAQRRSEAKFYRYDGLLQSFDAKDKVTEKRWTMDREGSHGQSKAVIRFTAPPEVKGVALLIHNHPERASDQWMWTPAIERDRRIAMQDRSTRFFGTDFSFEDLEERDVDQYDYSLLGSEAIDGAACWKIQSTPKQSRSSQYTRSTAWIRKDNYVVARLDNFVNNDVVRRLTYSSIENIQGIWTARQLEMSDLRRQTRTRLSLQQVKYNAPMKDEEFTLQAIRR